MAGELENDRANQVVPPAVEARRNLLRGLGLPVHAAPHEPAPLEASLLAPIIRRGNAAPGMPVLALIATRNHLPFADIAASSFLQHHDDFAAFLLLVDGTETDRTIMAGVNILLLQDLALPDTGWLAAKLNATEFSNSLKPVFLSYLAQFADLTIYMDCDTAVFARFTAMIEALDTSDLILTPHMMALFPRPQEQWRHPNNADIFNSGLINAGVFGIRLAKTAAFLEFWREANLLHAWSPGEGRQTDQQFLNWAIVCCDNVLILRDKSYNVAYWNLHERSFRHVQTQAGSGDTPAFEVEGQPLTFFHFSGFDPSNTLSLSHHDQRYSVYTLPSIALILEWYSRELHASAFAHLSHDPYTYDTLGNGIRLNPFLRDILKRYDIYVPRFDASTTAGADGLCAFLMSPLAASGSRLPLIAAVVYDARPDLQDVFPAAHTDLEPIGFHRWFCQHAGVEYGVEALIARFRHALESDSMAGFSAEIIKTLPPAMKQKKFLGSDRRLVAAELKIAGRSDLANALLTAETEWFFYSDFSAILTIYAQRADLRQDHPDLFGRSHRDFLFWLSHHAVAEHQMPAAAIAQFADKTASQVLARLFSILSRREDLGAMAVEELLSDQPGRLLRALIRSAGDGLEYDLADIEVVCFLHKHNRAVLVPLYLELPQIRRRPISSRTQEGAACIAARIAGAGLGSRRLPHP